MDKLDWWKRSVKDQTTGERWGNYADVPNDSGGSDGYGAGMPNVKKVFIDAGHGGSDPGEGAVLLIRNLYKFYNLVKVNSPIDLKSQRFPIRKSNWKY